jgi:hypothetical protein
MRAFEGQRSDNQPLKRSRPEKEKLLRELRETLAGMKSHTSPALRQSVQKRIADLEAELKEPAPSEVRPRGGDRPRSR